MRVIDDDITPHKAADARHQQELWKERNSVREIKLGRAREGGTLNDRQRALGTFSIIIFDSATSSFLALLVIKSYRKKLKRFKRTAYRFRSEKMLRTIFRLRSSVM